MKKGLTLLIAIVALMCVFALSICAAGADVDAYGTITEIGTVAEPSVLDTTSRVVIEASDGTFYTFPSYYILADDSYFTWVKNDALNEIIGFSGSATDLRKQIVRMEIPQGIEDMNSGYNGGAYVFEDATKLVEVTLPSTLTKMGGYVFNRCSNLVTINGMQGFMSRAQMIGTLMLNGTKWGQGFDLVIPTTITEIPDNCFQGTKISSVTFHNKLVQIGSRSFQDCVNLTSVTLPSSLVTLKNHSFAACTSLSSVDMSKCTKLTAIGEYCFEKAVITSFDFTPFAKTITSMGQGVFNRCQSLTTVTGYELCDNITSIGANMFQFCPLTTLTFPKNITSIGSYAFFQHCSAQTELRIPNGVTTIGDHAFVRNNNNGAAPSSVKIYLPGKLTTITGNYNFEYWNFTEMYIPKTLEAVSQGFVNGTLRKGVVYYYTGTYDAENTESNLPINSSNNHALLEAEWIDFDDFTGASSDKNYIVYNYNHCDAFYYGYDYDKSSTNCTQGTTCSRCGRTGENFTPYEQHDKTEVLIMPSFTEDGIYNCECANDGCTVIDVKDKTIKAIFTAKGYSTNPEKNAINGGYSVELDSLALYNRLNGAITYGVVIANAKGFDGEFFDKNNKVNTNKALQVEIDSQYSNFDCSISFGANTGVDLSLVICAYVITDDGVVFIQKDSGSDVTIGSNAFKSVTLAQVVALIPAPVSKEN